MKLVSTLALATFVAGAAAQAPPPLQVELDMRPQPGRDLTAEYTTEAITTVRVVEDRGIGARSEGRPMGQPATVHLHTRQSMRLVTGAAQADGAFAVELHFQDKTVSAQLPDGSLQTLPQAARLNGLKITGLVDRGGALRESSVRLAGASAQDEALLMPVLSAVLKQAASVPPLVLSTDRTVPQTMTMQLPVPHIGTLNMRLQVLHRLLGVEDGVATAQQSYTMDFDTPPGVLKMTAEGSGSGLLRYDVAARQVPAQQTRMLIKMLLETPQAVLEVQMNTRQSASIGATPAR